MENYINFSLQKLKAGGLKITKPRQMLVEFLAKSNKVLSPYEIRDMLKKQRINADVVTIYRVLEMLETMGLVHKVLAFNGYIRCNTKDFENAENSCHHYLICKSCHKVEEVEGEDLSALEKRIVRNHKFKVDSHYLEFIGFCAKCGSSKVVSSPSRLS